MEAKFLIFLFFFNEKITIFDLLAKQINKNNSTICKRYVSCITRG